MNDIKSAKMSALAELIKKLFAMEAKEHAGTKDGEDLLALGKTDHLGEESIEPDMEVMKEKANPLKELKEDFGSEIRRGSKFPTRGKTKGVIMAAEVNKPAMAGMGRGRR